MSDKRMFIIPDKLMGKIERHRGQLSRTEFVDYCIECVIRSQVTGSGGRIPPRGGQPDIQPDVVPSSLDRLKHQVINALEENSLLNSTAIVEQPGQPMPAGAGGAVAQAAAMPAPVVTNTVVERTVESVVEMAPEVEAKQESKLKSMPFNWLWVPAMLLFGFGDTLTSYLVFSAGGREANPILSMMMQLTGGGMMSFVAIKAAIMVSLVLISWFWMKKHAWLVPAALSALGGYLVVHNIINLMGLR